MKKNWRAIVEEALDELENIGDVTFIAVIPGGSINGLEYNPDGVDVVFLTEHEFAYRRSNDAYDGDFAIGDADDIAELCEEIEQKVEDAEALAPAQAE